MKTNSLINFEYLLNVLGVLGLSLVMLMALYYQFGLGELPCPLCLLQRIGVLLMSFGFLLNLRFGLRPSHYAMVLLGSVFTGFAALRQISLHIIPGSGSYGSAIFGLHMYTWSFIFASLAIIITSVMLGCDRQYEQAPEILIKYKRITILLLVMFLIFATVNIISTWMECGWKQCPDNPMTYLR